MQKLSAPETLQEPPRCSTVSPVIVSALSFAALIAGAFKERNIVPEKVPAAIPAFPDTPEAKDILTLPNGSSIIEKHLSTILPNQMQPMQCRFRIFREDGTNELLLNVNGKVFRCTDTITFLGGNSPSQIIDDLQFEQEGDDTSIRVVSSEYGTGTIPFHQLEEGLRAIADSTTSKPVVVELRATINLKPDTLAAQAFNASSLFYGGSNQRTLTPGFIPTVAATVIAHK